MRISLLTFLSALFAACLIAPIRGQTSAQIANNNANDINALNYALALEALEAVYYTCHLYPLNITNTDCAGRNYTAFTQADFVGQGYNASVYQAFILIGQQELSHQQLLTSVISARSGTPVPRCFYNYSVLSNNNLATVAQFIALSSVLENTGVSAYTGALNAFSDSGLAQVAATIATVEARHAAWLYQITGVQPFATSGFDTALTPAQVAGIVGPALSSSTCVSTLPTIRPYGVNGTGATTWTYTGPLARGSGISYTTGQRANDLKTLNYALMLEELEANFYYQAGLIFNQASFTNAGYSAQTYNYFGVIAANEQTHVAVLRTLITAYGGNPVQNCTYNFTAALASLGNYITYAQILENTGVSAYDGAANTLTDTTLQQAAATIATIEARHAAFLNVLIQSGINNNSNAFPSGYDNPIAPGDIITRVLQTGLITACPFVYDGTFTPVVLPFSAGFQNASTGGFQNASTGTYSSSGSNGAASSATFSMAMIAVAVIASLALAL